MEKELLKQFRQTAAELRSDARREYMGILFDAVVQRLPYDNNVLTSENPSDTNLHGSFVYGRSWGPHGKASNHLEITLRNDWAFSCKEHETLAHFHVKQRKKELDIVLLGENGKPLSGKPFFTIAYGRTKPTKADEEKFFNHIIDLFPEAVRRVRTSKKAYANEPCGLL